MGNRQILTKNKLGSGQLLKVSRFKEAIKRTKPHKHDGYFELICILEGEGFHQVDLNTYPIQPPELYFLKPDQLHCWQFTAIPKGYVLLFREEYFNELEEAPIINLIQTMNETSRVPIENSVFMESVFEELKNACEKPDSFSKDLINGYLRSIFSKIIKDSNARPATQKIVNTLFQTFQKLIIEHSSELHLVTQYASILHTTPQNLNAITRKNTGKSASELISDQLILEAKRNILHTDLSMSEIAELLHFSDSSYFVRFFKRIVGTTPYQFRTNYFQ